MNMVIDELGYTSSLPPPISYAIFCIGNYYLNEKDDYDDIEDDDSNDDGNGDDDGDDDDYDDHHD